MKRNAKEKRMTLAHARKVIAYWDHVYREKEADEAQAEYLEMLANIDEHMPKFRRWLRYRPKRGRAEAIAHEEAYSRRSLRAARRRAERGVLLSERVTQ
jgi:hypothetical protein